MKALKLFLCLALLVLTLSVSAQSRKVIDQQTNSIIFSSDEKLWGLEVNNKVIFSSQYKSVDYQNGLYILGDINGLWNVSDATGSVKLKWTKASDVKVAEKFVLFKNADGNKALIYDRKTWTLTTATETTYDDIYKETRQRIADKNGTPILEYETAAERSRREWDTQPRVVTKNGKQYIMFQDIEVGNAEKVVSLNKDYDSDGRWYFMAKNGTSQKWGVAFVKKENPSKILFSIAFNYTKIEDANNGWQMLNCHLADGTVELRWYGGSTTAEKSIPATVQR